MNEKEVIEQLKNLKEHCKSGNFTSDIEALDYAINLMHDCKCSLLHRFNEGDRVQIIPDLIVGEYYDGLLFSARMESCRGKELVISVSSSGEYLVEDLPYLFNDEMLEPAD